MGYTVLYYVHVLHLFYTIPQHFHLNRHVQSNVSQHMYNVYEYVYAELGLRPLIICEMAFLSLFQDKYR